MKGRLQRSLDKYQNIFQRTKGKEVSTGDSRMLKDKYRLFIDKIVQSQELNVLFHSFWRERMKKEVGHEGD